MRHKIKIALLKKAFIILSCLSFLTANSQTKDSTEVYITPVITKNKYLSFLLLPDNNTQSSVFNVRIQYLYTSPSYLFRRGGTEISLGLNLARFFTKKIILGLSLNTKPFFAGFTNQYFSNQFVADFNTNFINHYGNATDSLVANVLRQGINHVNGFKTRGNYPLFFGIAFSPFPQKYGGFLLEIKKGGADYPFYGNYSGEQLGQNNDKGDVLSLITVKNYLVELSFKPYKFFNSKRIILSQQKAKHLYKFITVSLCYEKFSLKNADFNGRPLSSMVQQDFISKYSKRNYFSIKLGLGLY